MFSMLDNNRGLSLIELVVTMVILGILTSMIIPSARMTSIRVKELELKRSLREIRTAIDDYKKYYDKAVDEKKIIPTLNNPGYPETLQTLVDGYDFGGLVNYKKKFLRKVPPDPFHPVKEGEPAWGMRSYEDEPDSNSWGSQNVFDVYSLSTATALDGTKYKDW
ncbi:type II secretion system pseudopilin PulG [Geomonas limicola]|uniref:Type II secretion system pseudopilin PulG n=1 Tax=Geomonas limicola TaxID=2740186 RepID=A0A6V8NFA7_9BACT|nr:type II secretion system protein [Geomonas limicola]GFO70263.1 type II secretion system pseudopilin PulG [Geomonas limicola]